MVMRIRGAAGILFLLGFIFFGTMTAIARMLPRTRGPVPAELDEDWRPAASRVRSIDEAMRVMPLYIAREHGSREAREASAIDHFVRDRFFHQPSYLSFRQDWVAATAGLFWINLRVPVLPDDILRHSRAICSQQAIVFMELLKRFGIHYAAVVMSWPSDDPAARGHFALAARVDGRWLYFDTDQEAERAGVPVERVIDGSALPVLYARKPALLAQMLRAAAHGQIRIEHVDEFPAPRGGLFQIATEWLSAWGWLVFGLLAAFFWLPRFLRLPRPVAQPGPRGHPAG